MKHIKEFQLNENQSCLTDTKTAQLFLEDLNEIVNKYNIFICSTDSLYIEAPNGKCSITYDEHNQKYILLPEGDPNAEYGFTS
jgi:hypothetical protein